MLTKIKVYACYTVKIYKNKPPTFFKTGASARRDGHGFACDFGPLQLECIILSCCKFLMYWVGVKTNYTI